MTADPFAHLDGAYVLGALDAAELAEFEAHLATCPACQARVEELRPTVSLLADVRANGPSLDPGPMPDTLLPGLLRKAGRERNRRRWWTAGVAGVAAACVITLAVVLWPSSKPASGPAPQAMQAVQASPVHATAKLVARKWGTEIDLRCRYAAGTIPDVPYRLRVTDTSNETYDGGSWTLVAGGSVAFSGGVAVPRADIKDVQITLEDGTPILQLSV